MDYLALAERHGSVSEMDERIVYFSSLEIDLIKGPDNCFRFHSGPLAMAA
jgi:tRNA isopentenyl-2-thiomethyl-A-37 hydroxylase MiaE